MVAKPARQLCGTEEITVVRTKECRDAIKKASIGGKVCNLMTSARCGMNGCWKTELLQEVTDWDLHRQPKRAARGTGRTLLVMFRCG